MSELSCDTLFIGRNETHDLSRYLNSAQHARSAASRLILDDVIDRSALEQAREGLGGRDIEIIEEPLIGLGVQKSTLEERDGRFSPRNSHPYDRRHDRHPP